MSVEKAKTIAEVAQIGLNIITTLIDRSEKKKADAKRLADLEAEVTRLKAGEGGPMTPRERARAIANELRMEGDRAVVDMIERNIVDDRATIPDIHTIGREHDLREAREVAERNAADCSHLRQSAISLAAERDAERQRADAAEKEAQEHFDNYQEMGEQVVQRDRRIAELETALRQSALDLGNLASMSMLGVATPVTLISGMEAQARAALSAPASPATAARPCADYGVDDGSHWPHCSQAKPMVCVTCGQPPASPATADHCSVDHLRNAVPRFAMDIDNPSANAASPATATHPAYPPDEKRCMKPSKYSDVAPCYNWLPCDEHDSLDTHKDDK